MSELNPTASGTPDTGQPGPGSTPAPARIEDPPARPVLTAPATLNVLGPIVGPIIGPIVTPPANLPVAGTQSGSLFHDRYDPNLRWYLPVFMLATPDPAFSFAATQTSEDQSGNPFNQAVLTLSVQIQDPPDVQQARAASPGLRFRQIPLDYLAVSLNVPYKDPAGTDATTAVAGQLSQGNGTWQVVINGLLGPVVIQVYQQLTSLSQATVTLQLSYSVWQHVIRWIWSDGPLLRRMQALVAPDPVAIDHPLRFQLIQPIDLPPPLGHAEPVDRFRPVDNGGDSPGTRRPEELWFTATATHTRTLQLGSTYAADSYRTQYTITPAGGAARPIIDATDLRDFTVNRSEFRELTTLGDVQRRYPSIARLYYGELTGTVIAVPVQYGIVCSSKGCAARVDAVVDPAGLSGSRFHLTFVLAPVIDPIDLARLAHDLASVPETQNRSLTLRLPGGIDNRGPATLAGFTAASLNYANGQDEGTLLLGLDIADIGTTPAVVNINLFLTQLTTPSLTLFGQIGVRLDDSYTPIVVSSVILNLSNTSNTDDILVSVAGDPALALTVATNRAPFDLHLTAFANITAEVIEIDIDETLPSGQSFNLPGGDATARSIAVKRSVPIPNPFPRQILFSYVDVHTENVQAIRHALILNATEVNFTAMRISQADIRFSLNDLPTVPVSSLTLTPAHRVDEVPVMIPMANAITTLNVTMTVTVTETDGSQRDVELSNDFVVNPIYLITTL
jgi:hypothetical protein